MAIIINGERIEDNVLQAEVMRLRRQPPAPDAMAHSEPPEPEQRAKENIISRTILQQQARKADLDIGDNDIEQALQRMLDSEGGKDAFFQRHHLTDNDLPRLRKHAEQNVRIEKLIDRICKDLPKPGEPDMLACYQGQLKQFVVPPQVRVSHIVRRPSGPDDQQLLDTMIDLRQQLRDGADFATLAEKHSECADEPTGDLGFFTRGSMVEGFEAVVFSMEPGEISPVFMTQFGYHIATVTDRKSQRQQTFEEVKDAIRQRLSDEREGKAIDAYVTSLRSSAIIVETEESKQQPAKTSKGKKRTKRRKK